ALARAGAALAIGSLPARTSLGDAAYAVVPGEEEMARTAAEIEACGAACFVRSFDLRSNESVAAFHETAAAAIGPIDILINAAGVCAQESIVEARDATWSMVIDINLNGAYRTIKRCLPGMIERRWGRIVNIASTAASAGFPRYGAYCASKHALLGLTRCVALEGAAAGVTCNAISPGTVATGMTRLGS